MLIGYIYMITSPTGRIYIGSTYNYIKRWADYKCYDCKYQRKLYNSLKKYGVENHIFEVIMECSIENMLKYETLIGWGFDVLDKENLNCKLPKLGDVYKVVSDETIIKMKISHKKRFETMSFEKRNKLGSHRKGKKMSSESIEKRTKLQKIPIIQLDLEDNFIKEWESARDAGKSLNISSSDICQCCKNKKLTCGNFKWKYLNQKLKEKPRKKRNDTFNKNKRSVIQMDLNENFIKNWDCIKDACRNLNITGTHISSCCRGKRNFAHGFKWKYKDA